jgi:phospholipid N-methyltransferase
LTYSATYSPDDNKLRLYASTRLDAETYARAKALGFRWAPKQDLFFAPMWTPEREDFLCALAGEIEDEDKSLVTRQEERAERFEDYSDKRERDATRAHAAVDAICEHIPLGQPILIGHHSEKRARKDADRITNGMRKAVKMWETAKYWEGRAAGALAHAKYKERPDVRARRIKTIEADRRRVVKGQEERAAKLALWLKVAAMTDAAKQTETAQQVANYNHLSMCFPLDKYPRELPASQYEGMRSLWDAIRDGIITGAQAAALAVAAYQRETTGPRWLAHYDNRLTYERAMLGETGYVEPPKRATKAILPLLNYPGEIQWVSPYARGEVHTSTAHAMTKAEFSAIYDDYKGTVLSADGSHRLRSALIGTPGKRGLTVVFITDSKQHDPAKEAARIDKAKAKLDETKAARAEVLAANRAIVKNHGKEPAPAQVETPGAPDFDAMRATLKAGVQVVTANQLFPTPRDLAQRVGDMADIQPGHFVLEPSAGTGALLGAIGTRWKGHNPERGAVHAVELNRSLACALERDFPLTTVDCGDFLEWVAPVKFDRIIMNPPFQDGADIKHILRARSMLAPGGKLVAICANGPRQGRALQELATSWEELPEGTFAGTNVRAVLLTMTANMPSELTEVGEQFVIPGCQKKAPAGKTRQPDLWEV